MAKALTATISRQITNKRLDTAFVFKLAGVDRSDFVIDWSISYDKSFGSATASFTLDNVAGIFGDSGGYKVYVGDIVEFSEKFGNDVTEFKKFYGIVDQRSIQKSAKNRTITITCLDYINAFSKTDVSIDSEGTKVEVTEEVLVPNYLPAPNDMLAQVFNFANDGLAQEPPPLITIRPKSSSSFANEDPQYDGFDILYSQGQLKLGTPLNVRDNYDVVAVSYYFYTKGLFAEEILEDIITAPDGYGKFMFNELTAQDVIDNHLTEIFSNVNDSGYDYMTPNYTTSNIIIKHQLSQAYYADSSGYDATKVYLDSVEGLPNSGSGSINGDLFTWSSIESGNVLAGVPTTGEYALSNKPSGSYMSYEVDYSAGQVWYLTYSKILSTLSSSDFNGLSGSVIKYIDYTYGRIILDAPISTSTIVSCDKDYSFSTLQATGVEINRMKINTREVATRFDAIGRVREYLAPNYIIRTEGDNKIWASYLSQKTTPDYTLSLIETLNYLEDDDLYTRVVFYGKNNNPTNFMIGGGVNFVTTGQNYKATAVNSELQYEKDEGNFLVYKTTISDAGKIEIKTIKPTVFINNVPVDDKPHLISQMPVVVTCTQRTETTVEEEWSDDPTVTTVQYYYYKIRFAHTSIDPTQEIKLYDAVGQVTLTIPPGSGGMDYGNGIYNVPGTSQNSAVEETSTASYTVFYSTAGIIIDFDTVRFKVSKQLLPTHTLGIVAATFQYWTALTPISNVGAVIDGRFDTQVQTTFFAEPPTGLPYAILDLGQIRQIQAIDIIAGFYTPDDIRKFDVDFKLSMKYSYDNITYYIISADTQNVQLTSGSSASFEEDKLGPDFSARYLRFDLEDVKKVDYGDGIWPVAFTELAAYDNIYLKAESKLIPATLLDTSIDLSGLTSGEYPTEIDVISTASFEVPESGQVSTAYVEEDAFTYTGVTATSFTGVQGLSSSHVAGCRVSQYLETDTDIYDDDGYLAKLGDRLYKQNKIQDEVLYDQERLNALAKAYNEEFYKNHTKAKINVLYAPYLKVGQTIALTDPYQGISNVNYFIESISDSRGSYELVIARYPM